VSDIATLWNVTYGDWAMDGADLATDQDLYTAILISLGTNAQAAPDDTIPGGATDPQGWWGDAYSTLPIGSKIWLLPRTPTPQTLTAAQAVASAALNWLITDGVAASVDVTAQFVAPATPGDPLQLVVQITVGRQGVPPVSFNYQWVWGQIS
jgi:phage gp46-like protein